MALRSVIADGSRPVELDADARVQHVRADDAARQVVRDQLVAAGWVVVVATAIPEPLDEARLGAARSGAGLGVDVAEAFLAAVRAEEAAARQRVEAHRNEARAAETELHEVGEARDQVLELLGAPALHRRQAAEVLAPLIEQLTRVGAAQLAHELRGWLDAVAAGTAAVHPTSLDLLARARELDRRWAEMGEGSFQSVPAVTRARDERDRLRELVVELEALLERGLGDEARRTIETAHSERLVAEDATPRRAARVEEARAAEAAVLGRYGFDSYTDYQIATSTAAVGDHARRVLPETIQRLDAATAALQEEIVRAEQLGRAVEAERERLAAEAEQWAGDDDVDELLALPSQLDAARVLLTSRLEELTAAHQDVDRALVAAATEATELGEEIAVREAELQAARHLVAELDLVWHELQERSTATLAALRQAVADTSVPGVVVEIAAHAVEAEAVVAVLDGATARVVLLSD